MRRRSDFLELPFRGFSSSFQSSLGFYQGVYLYSVKWVEGSRHQDFLQVVMRFGIHDRDRTRAGCEAIDRLYGTVFLRLLLPISLF